MDIVYSIEELAMDILHHDEDHKLRAEAADVLGKSPSPAVRKALEKALQDDNVAVREAAQRSLNELS